MATSGRARGAPNLSVDYVASVLSAIPCLCRQLQKTEMVRLKRILGENRMPPSFCRGLEVPRGFVYQCCLHRKIDLNGGGPH